MSDAADHRAGTKTAVSAGIEKRFHLVGDDGAVALDAGLQPHHAGVARRAGDELFAIFHHHLHRPAAAQGQQIANRLVDGRALAAEIAADGDWIDANFFLGKIEGRRHARLQPLRRLARRPHLNALLLVDPDQAAMGLEKRLMHARHRVGVLDDDIGLGEAARDIAAGKHILDESVGRLVELLGQTLIAIDIGVNQRRAVLRRRDNIEHRRQLFVLNVDQLQRRFGLFESIRRHRCHPLTDEAHLILGQDGNVAITPAVENAAHVIASQYRPHPRRFLSARSVHTDNPRMGMGTAQRLRPQRSRQQHIRGITRVAGDFRGIIRARRRLTDYLVTHDGSPSELE